MKRKPENANRKTSMTDTTTNLYIHTNEAQRMRLAQPRWTTVLLPQLAMFKSTEFGHTYSGNTLITLPPIRLWQMPQTRSSVMVTCRERVDRPSVPSPTNNCACVLMSSAF